MKYKYIEKFKDPRWQKKRLEIMQRANFECENKCFSKNRTLSVHHGYYEKGYDPWDYDNDTLWCLCEDCHKEIQGKLRDLHMQLAKVHPARYDQVMAYLVKYQAPLHGGKK